MEDWLVDFWSPKQAPDKPDDSTLGTLTHGVLSGTQQIHYFMRNIWKTNSIVSNLRTPAFHNKREEVFFVDIVSSFIILSCSWCNILVVLWCILSQSTFTAVSASHLFQRRMSVKINILSILQCVVIWCNSQFCVVETIITNQIRVYTSMVVPKDLVTLIV